MPDDKLVMIVDDDQDALEFCEVMLSKIEGIKTITANSGIEALEMLKTNAASLLILDVQMPEKDGFEVFADLKKDDATKDIPVIMLTGIGEKTGINFSGNDMGEYLGKEPEAYIEKPAKPEILQETVSKVLGL